MEQTSSDAMAARAFDCFVLGIDGVLGAVSARNAAVESQAWSASVAALAASAAVSGRIGDRSAGGGGTSASASPRLSASPCSEKPPVEGRGGGSAVAGWVSEGGAGGSSEELMARSGVEMFRNQYLMRFL